MTIWKEFKIKCTVHIHIYIYVSCVIEVKFSVVADCFNFIENYDGLMDNK